MIDHQQKYCLSSEILSQKIDDETILLDMKSENYFGLNEVGSRVLEILKTGTDPKTLVDILLEEYVVEKQELEKDITELLQELLAAGLIEAET